MTEVGQDVYWQVCYRVYGPLPVMKVAVIRVEVM